MALTRCPECNNKISNEAVTCPNCGKPLKIQNDLRINYDQNIQSKKQDKLPLGCNIILVGIPIVLFISIIFLYKKLDKEPIDNSYKEESIVYSPEDIVNGKELESLFNSLGGEEKLDVKEDERRCNYFKSNFILNKDIKDTLLLKGLANFIAVKVRKDYITEQIDCPLPVCSNVHIYMNETDFQNSNKSEYGQNDIVYSECIPLYPKGDAWINKLVYEKYK